MIDKVGEPMIICADPALPANLRGVERLLRIALPASREALQSVAAVGTRLPLSLLIGLPEQRPGRARDLDGGVADQMAAALSDIVAIEQLACFSMGNASGLLALEQALALIRSGRSDLCLVVGIESYLEPETLEWLDWQDRLHSEATIWGITPAEGAGCCLVASERLADSLGLSSLPELISAGSAVEANRINTETVCIGEGLTDAFRKTLTVLPSGLRVSHTICDMNGEPYRGDEYGLTMMRTSRWFEDEGDFSTPADCWGDIGAASGPLFAALVTSAMTKRYSPGPVTFLWASSDSGLRAAAVLQAPVTGD